VAVVVAVRRFMLWRMMTRTESVKWTDLRQEAGALAPVA
jgi:hypothetical protein